MVSEQSMLKICKTKKSTSQVKTNLLTNYKIQEFCESSEEVVFKIKFKDNPTLHSNNNRIDTVN